MFEDRRHRGERRRKNLPAAVPADGCRRAAGERRHLLRQYHPQPWWLQANYAEELQPPVLGINKLRKPTPPRALDPELAKERSR
jgi:hypothetical protein